jgi:hypothetical protein
VPHVGTHAAMRVAKSRGWTESQAGRPQHRASK